MATFTLKSGAGCMDCPTQALLHKSCSKNGQKSMFIIRAKTLHVFGSTSGVLSLFSCGGRFWREVHRQGACQPFNCSTKTRLWTRWKLGWNQVLRYLARLVLWEQRSPPSHAMICRQKAAEIQSYPDGAKIQYTEEEDLSELLDKDGKTYI